MNSRQLLRRLSRGEFHNVSFADAQRLVEDLGFRLDRIKGSHLFYEHPNVAEPVVLQPRRHEAKAYQLRQLILLVGRYDLRLEDDE